MMVQEDTVGDTREFLADPAIVLAPAAESLRFPPDLILAFARKIARPASNAILIGRKNERLGWVSIEEAVKDGMAFAVPIREDILAVDADSSELAARAFELAQELRGRSHNVVVVSSGRPGHVHLFCVIRDRAIRERFRDRAKAMGLDLPWSIRPPLSPHRLGLPVGLMDPEDAAEALAALTSVAPSSLSPRFVRLLCDGDFAAAGYESRSHAIQGLALAAVNAGWNFDDFLDAMTRPHSRAGDKVRDRADRHKYLTRCWEKACRKAQRDPLIASREDALSRLAAIDRALMVPLWPRQAGTTDRLVLETLIALGQSLGKVTFDADVRTLAERTGFSIATVSRSLQRLRQTRWISLVRRARPGRGHAAVWSLCLPPTMRSSMKHSHTPPGDGDVSPDAFHMNESTWVDRDEIGDLWRREGLGPARYLVWRALQVGKPQTVRQLAGVVGRKSPTVRRHLAVLEKHGLAQRGPDGWSRGLADPQMVAMAIGAAGQQARDQERHRDQRERFRRALAGWLPTKMMEDTRL